MVQGPAEWGQKGALSSTGQGKSLQVHVPQTRGNPSAGYTQLSPSW